MSLSSRIASLVGMGLVVLSCSAEAGTSEPRPAPTPSPQARPPTEALATAVVEPSTPIALPTQTRVPAPTVTGDPEPTQHTETTIILVSYDTYETEENVRDEIGEARGVVRVAVTQLEVIVTYDPEITSREEIIALLKRNPEVRIREEP